MQPGIKKSYDPAVLIAFYLNCLPAEVLQHIPRSTQHDWQRKDRSILFGHEWYSQNQHLFDTLQQVSNNNALLKANLALLRIIAISRFMAKYADQLKANLFFIRQTVLINISKVNQVFDLQKTLRLLQLSYGRYLTLRKPESCSQSALSLCRLKHPAQLLKKEIMAIKDYCLHENYIRWPLSSVYHQLRKQGAVFFSIQTFYKYAGLLNLKRKAIAGRRKNHHTGIRASAPLQILHADTTLFTLTDHTKAYIYLVQDNFSRKILAAITAADCRASHTLANLTKAYREYIVPSGLKHCQLITDDGSENHGPVTEFITTSKEPAIRHLVAQKTIIESNSMIEAANKQIKYRFLYHQHISSLAELEIYVQQAIEDYNNRPHDVLKGLTPAEVLNGKNPAAVNYAAQLNAAKTNRLTENKKLKCCGYSI